MGRRRTVLYEGWVQGVNDLGVNHGLADPWMGGHG